MIEERIVEINNCQRDVVMKDQTEVIDRLVEEYADTMKRICYSYTKNYHDTQDIMQNVFLKYLKINPNFENKEHEKTWIIRVTMNLCKDLLRSFFRKNQSLDELEDMQILMYNEQRDDLSLVRAAVQKLPPKYKNVIWLYYYEGYSAVEIAKILEKKENTIYTWLKRGKEQLRIMLGGDFFDK